MENSENGYSRDEIFEQLKKIADEEERLYGGKQMSFDFAPEPAVESPDASSGIGNTQDSLDEQADVDFDKITENLGLEDPVRLNKLWNGAQALIIANIPKGKLRRFALDEKLLFLKASANTKDSKQTFIHAVQTAYDLAEKWIQSNENKVELGMAYWDLNERSGFHSKKKQSGFNANLKALLKVPPPQKDKKDSK